VSLVAPLLTSAAAARSRFRASTGIVFSTPRESAGLLAGGKHLADDGWLTGPPPDDPAERKTLPEGWLPWSVRVPIPGTDTTTYIPFSNLAGQLGVPLALAGLLPPWLAGLGMASSSLLVVLNSLRLAR
jgi:hypothetical protein